MVQPCRSALLLTFLIQCAIFAYAADLSEANAAYNRTDYQLSLRLLNKNSQNPEELFLIGKNYYRLGTDDKDNYKTAADFFEKAANLNPNSAEYLLWLGKAWGRRAATTGFFAKPKSIGYAKKAKQYFEAAHALDPKNREAAWATFLYYLEAPDLLGGGIGKAEKVAGEIAALNTADGECALALIYEERKNFPAAKEHWLVATKIDPGNRDVAIQYAKFLRRRKDHEGAENILLGQMIGPTINPAASFELAGLYIDIGRKQEAKEILLRYVDPALTKLTPDDEPVSEAKKMLDNVK